MATPLTRRARRPGWRARRRARRAATAAHLAALEQPRFYGPPGTTGRGRR